MKNIILFLLVIYTLNLSAIERTVKLDGTGDFISIQSAVDASTNNDIITVYPGDYRENINIGSKSLTLQSLYAQNPDTLYIHNTRIIGQPSQSAIRAENSQNISINGFTIMNNENQEEGFYWIAGGGINLYHCNAVLKNNIITNSISGLFGGGIGFTSNNYFSTISFENNKIFNNKCYGSGGGLFLFNKVNVTFSSEYKNSIFNNSSICGKDIYSRTRVNPINIVLKKGSIILDNFDQYFIAVNHDNFESPSEISVSIEEGSLPTINHDLYVAPWGDDTNSGLDELNPLKSIDYATKIIASDSLNPKTVYLASGVYSHSANDQQFPCSIKSDTKIIGADMFLTILDAERVASSIGGFADRNAKAFNSVHFENFTLKNGGNINNANYNNSPLIASANNINITNILIDNNQFYMNNGVNISYFTTAKLKNIIIRNGRGISNCYGLNVLDGDTLFVENYILDSLVVINDQGGSTGIWFDIVKKAIMNNISITNNNAFTPTMFQILNVLQFQPEESFDSYMNNILFANNTSTEGDWDTPKIGLLDEWGNTFHLNNFTVANNRGSTYALGVGSDFEMNNMILYNPEMPVEFQFGGGSDNNIRGEIKNSYIYDRTNKIAYFSNPSNLMMHGVIDADSPMFAGMYDTQLSMSQPEYYHLYEGSPCIDSGIADTSGYYYSETDLAGNQRVWNNRIDLGCFEYGSPHVGTSNQEIPTVFSYNLKNYPNPISLHKQGFTIITFDYPEEVRSEPEIEIYNIKGQKVKSLKTGMSFKELAQKAGLQKDNPIFSQAKNYSVVWDTTNDQGRKVSSGIYFYRAKVDGRVLQTKKMAVLK